MTEQQHPITPPPELVQEWWAEALKTPSENAFKFLATRAAQWGADQELEACEKWLEWNHSDLLSRELRAARRPKPPSLKQQALDEVHISFDKGYLKEKSVNIIRRALEALPE